MEATLTLTRTSVRPKAGILTWRTSAPGAASGFTTASMVLSIRATLLGHPYPHKLFILASRRLATNRLQGKVYCPARVPSLQSSAASTPDKPAEVAPCFIHEDNGCDG